ncbi:hypothetical protein RJ641_032001, partial [Dillenia turbinata]
EAFRSKGRIVDEAGCPKIKTIFSNITYRKTHLSPLVSL